MQIIECCDIIYRSKKLQSHNQLYGLCGKNKDGSFELLRSIAQASFVFFFGELMTKTCGYLVDKLPSI